MDSVTHLSSFLGNADKSGKAMRSVMRKMERKQKQVREAKENWELLKVAQDIDGAGAAQAAKYSHRSLDSDASEDIIRK